MREITIREYPREEYLKDLRFEIEVNGLKACVQKRSELINEEASSLRYVSHGLIQEWLTEIMDLIDLSTESKR